MHNSRAALDSGPNLNELLGCWAAVEALWEGIRVQALPGSRAPWQGGKSRLYAGLKARGLPQNLVAGELIYPRYGTQEFASYKEMK